MGIYFTNFRCVPDLACILGVDEPALNISVGNFQDLNADKNGGKLDQLVS